MFFEALILTICYIAGRIEHSQVVPLQASRVDRPVPARLFKEQENLCKRHQLGSDGISDSWQTQKLIR